MSANERILIVDDDRTQATTLARVLGLEGYQTCVAESGAEALREVDQGDVDLVLTDLRDTAATLVLDDDLSGRFYLKAVDRNLAVEVENAFSYHF